MGQETTHIKIKPPSTSMETFHVWGCLHYKIRLFLVPLYSIPLALRDKVKIFLPVIQISMQSSLLVIQCVTTASQEHTSNFASSTFTPNGIFTHTLPFKISMSTPISCMVWNDSGKHIFVCALQFPYQSESNMDLSEAKRQKLSQKGDRQNYDKIKFHFPQTVLKKRGHLVKFPVQTINTLS